MTISEPVPKREVLRARTDPGGRFTVYSTADALPQSSVHAAFQDSRGFLWFGTQEGVVRFDGRRWRSFSTVDGLAYGFVQAIAEDAEGCLWFGTRIGLSRFDPVRQATRGWTSFDSRDGLADHDVRALLADPGGLWIATRGGLNRYGLDGSWLTFTTADGLPSNDVFALHRDVAGSLWVGTARGLARACPAGRDASVAAFTAAAGPGPEHITCVTSDADGNIWAGTQGGGVIRLEPSGVVITLTSADGLAADRVVAAIRDSDGDLWFATLERGVSQLRAHRTAGERRWRTISIEDGLSDFSVCSLLQDRSGVFWFGTIAGLTSWAPEGTYRGKTWTSYRKEDGLCHGTVACIAQDRKGRYWFGTFGGGVSRLDASESPRVWATLTTREGLSHNLVRAIREDRAGRIWFGTFGAGLCRFDPGSGSWSCWTTADRLAGDAVRCIVEDGEGMFWVGTDGGGVSVFDPLEEPHFRNITTLDGIPSNRISSILHDSAGRVWIGTYEGGVACRGGGDGWTTYDRSDGLAANDVYCVAEGKDGVMWFGTGGSGLSRFDGRSWRTYDRRDGLPNDVIYQILVDPAGALYCSTNRGVFRLSFHHGQERIIAFDRSDGLADDECNGGASLREPGGIFWFGTLRGASFIDPAGVPERVPPCSTWITAFSVDERPVDLVRTPAIEDSKYEFIFEYAAVEFVSAHKVRFRSRLRPLEEEWSQVTADSRIRYTNLRSGRYVFQVQARNWGGEWSAPASLSFEVIRDPERQAEEEALELERIRERVLEETNARLEQLARELRESNDVKAQLIDRLRIKEGMLETQAREDPLTGLMNRRYLDIHLEQEFARAKRYDRRFTVVMGDVDRFKSINDRFSHAVGDLVLREMAAILRDGLRSVDIVARYGGDELVLLLPEAGLDGARSVCEKLRESVERHDWSAIGEGLEVTISFGAADDRGAASAKDILARADHHLLEAKRRGRNRVES